MLSNEELEEIKNIAEKWLVKRKNNSFELESVYRILREIDFVPVVKAFSKRLDTIPCKFSKSEQVSGSVCFFGGVMTSILNYGYIEEMEGLFTFALCYMLIDHYLDDHTISHEEKKKSMGDIRDFIYDGKRNSENPLINAAADRYLSLINRVPNCKKYILKLFEAELKGVKIQNRNDLARDVYLQIAEEKGGLTGACIGSIIGLSDEAIMTGGYMTAVVIQYVDDLLDIKDDTDANIYTLVRYDMDRGDLDAYIYASFKKTINLSPVYDFFKPILLTGLVLGVHDNPGCISESLQNLFNRYDIFNEETSKDTLNLLFHDKLYSYIEEKNI